MPRRIDNATASARRLGQSTCRQIINRNRYRHAPKLGLTAMAVFIAVMRRYRFGFASVNKFLHQRRLAPSRRYMAHRCYIRPTRPPAWVCRQFDGDAASVEVDETMLTAARRPPHACPAPNRLLFREHRLPSPTRYRH